MPVSLILSWAEMLLRWAHVISGIAWIGSSFYFIALDAGLAPAPHLEAGVKGESWQVHGGGFYRMQKYLVAPSFMPAELTWFKWEAYTTWIFGFSLLVLVYFFHPTLYLIDPSVAPLSPAAAVAIAALSLAAGWIVYDLLCRSVIGRDRRLLAAAGFLLLVATAWGYSHLFSGRGAYIEIGALVGSIMVGNVFFVIIPNQKIVVADLLAGRTPADHLGDQAKQRSLHNNYLTLPVVFVMLSNHYAFTYGSRYNWIILAAVFVASFFIRHYFNTMHAGLQPDWRLWPAAAVPLLGAFALTLATQAPAPAVGAAPVPFARVAQILHQRCGVCHAARPTYPGIAAAPLGVMFDTRAEILANASRVEAMAVATHTMPLGNVTHITPAERATLGAWIAAGAKP